MTLEQSRPVTRRQREALLLYADGLGYKQIAVRMRASQWTVKGYVKAAKERLQLPSRVEVLQHVLGALPSEIAAQRTTDPEVPNIEKSE